jgi:DNA mismatch repair protein MutS
MNMLHQLTKQRSIWLFVSSLAMPFSSFASVFDKIAQENLKVFSYNPSIPSSEVHGPDTFAYFLEREFTRQLNPSPEYKRRFVFSMLQDHEKRQPSHNTTSDILDFVTWQDLHLLCGPRSNPALYLGAQIDRTVTEMGRAILFKKLVQPINDIAELTSQQALVRELVTNQELFDQLDRALKALSTSENVIYSFSADDIFKSFTARRELKIPLCKELAIKSCRELGEKLNKNSIAMNISERMEEIRHALALGSMAAGTVVLPLYALIKLTRYARHADTIYNFARDRLGVSALLTLFSASGFVAWTLNQLLRNRATEIVNGALGGVNYGAMAYGMSWNFFDDTLIRAYIQKKLILVAQYLGSIKSVHEIIKQNPILYKHFSCITNLDRLFTQLPQDFPEFKELLELLATDTFKGDASFLSHAGRILAAFKLMHEHKEKLIDGLIAVGELDALLSVARLYKERSGADNRWCFPVYKEHAHAPAIEIEQFWNPCIDPQLAVSNSAYLGTRGNPRTFIITGPNAGGKSTTMKAIVISLILAQSLGIAPASRLEFTPCRKIMTYLNITDDIAAGNSHFQAGVIRAQELISMLDTLKEHEYGFIAVDEVFNGTTYLEGQAAAYGLIELLGRHPRTLCTTATHFPLITQLEDITDGKLFKNYKVSVAYTKAGKLIYPFKLESGIAQQNIAFDILKEAGFTSSFLENARRFVPTDHETHEPSSLSEPENQGQPEYAAGTCIDTRCAPAA